MTEEKVLKRAVIVFPVQGESVLLARKAYKIGAGCWNGYGGGIELGESAIDAAIRELAEESGLATTQGDLEKVARINFYNQKSDGSHSACEASVFLARRWSGKVSGTDEMRNPTWFAISALPLSEMMPADTYWLPAVLRGRKLFVEAWYGPYQKELLQPVAIRDLTAEE